MKERCVGPPFRRESNKKVSQRQTNTQAARNWSTFVKSSPAPSCEGIKSVDHTSPLCVMVQKKEREKTDLSLWLLSHFRWSPFQSLFTEFYIRSSVNLSYACTPLKTNSNW